MKIITRASAKAQGLTRYYTGKPCKHGHTAERYTNKGKCVECERNHSNKYYQDNKDSMNAYSKQYYANNKQVLKEKRKTYTESVRDTLREYNRNYYHRNKASRLAVISKRRATKLNATPAWLTDIDTAAIECLYALAVYASKQFEPHHVDHIIPLQGKTVCGLHVPSNLRVIPATKNISKGNRY